MCCVLCQFSKGTFPLSGTDHSTFPAVLQIKYLAIIRKEAWSHLTYCFGLFLSPTEGARWKTSCQFKEPPTLQEEERNIQHGFTCQYFLALEQFYPKRALLALTVDQPSVVTEYSVAIFSQAIIHLPVASTGLECLLSLTMRPKTSAAISSA